MGTESSSSCSFLPGFEPCSGQSHIHRDLARAQLSPQIEALPLVVCESLAIDRTREDEEDREDDVLSDET
ncbi:hypothetical protein PIB30_099208, partial [Stylosanthes scabra]|nr:hypothetical protein [Stylosanthes scabra]